MATANYDLDLQGIWQFHLGEIANNEALGPGVVQEYCKAGNALRAWMLQEASWEEVSVPHDWVTVLPVSKEADYAAGYKKREIGWYQKKVSLSPDAIESARLVFEGVSGHSTVYVNGILAARNFSSYNRFSCEIGHCLVPGEENTIVVYVDARHRELWSYEGAGIYRPAHIEFRNDSHIDSEKCFVRGIQTKAGWQVIADIAVSQTEDAMELHACLKDIQGNVLVKEIGIPGKQMILKPAPDTIRLWSPEDPYLYSFECALYSRDVCTDKVKFPVGLRHIEWKANQGMFLNGEYCLVKGMCCHQDHAGVGVAVPTEVMEYRIRRLKESGANAYRCAHHASAESLLEICDRLGMLVMVENRNFNLAQNTLEQLDALVYLSRNHPCVFLYSLFNEEKLQAEERGVRIAARMRERIFALDDTRAVTGGQNLGLLAQQNASDVLDVVGMNYGLASYEGSHERLPHKLILGTENCPTFATRGVYTTDKEKQIFACYGEEWPSNFSESLEETMVNMYAKPYVAGSFVWAGFDHRGEVNPHEWPSVISHWGFHDYCGFAKDTAHLLAAWYKKKLCVHLVPHWNWKPGEEVRVCAFTNAETAELFLNGKSLGQKAVQKRRAEWTVPFTAGEISVIAERSGETVRDEVRTAGAATCLCMTDDAPKNGGIRIINIRAMDAFGVPVPDFCGTVSFTVEKGRILGVGNGDPNGHQADIADSVPLFNGCGQLIVECKAGSVTAACEGLEPSRLQW